MVQGYSYIQCHDLLANRFIRIIVVELLFRKTAAFLCNILYTDILDNFNVARVFTFAKKICSNHFGKFEQKSVFGLMYGKNPTFFLLSFVAFQNAFAASETQDHLMIYFIDQAYGTGHWPTYSTSCGLIIFVSVIHSDISPGISETKFMVSQTPLLISENYHRRSYLNFYFLPASIASLFCGRDMLFTCKSDLLLKRHTATWNVFVKQKVILQCSQRLLFLARF